MKRLIVAAALVTALFFTGSSNAYAANSLMDDNGEPTLTAEDSGGDIMRLTGNETNGGLNVVIVGGGSATSSVTIPPITDFDPIARRGLAISTCATITATNTAASYQVFNRGANAMFMHVNAVAKGSTAPIVIPARGAVGAGDTLAVTSISICNGATAAAFFSGMFGRQP